MIETLLFYFTFWAAARYTFNIIQFRAVINQHYGVLSWSRLLVKFRFFFIKFLLILFLILFLWILKLCVAALRNIHQIRLLPLVFYEILNMFEQLILRLFKSSILLTVATFLVCIVFFEREIFEHVVWGVVMSIDSQRNNFHERILQNWIFLLIYGIAVNNHWLGWNILYLGIGINFLYFYSSKFPSSVIIIEISFVCFYFDDRFSQLIQKLLFLMSAPGFLMMFVEYIIQGPRCLLFDGNV